MEKIKDWILQHLSSIIIAILTVLSPMFGIMIVTGLLIAFDFISGIAAAHKRGEKITSRKMSNTISKIIFYNLALFTSMGVQYLVSDLIPISKLIIGVIAMVEAKSIYENIGFVLGIDFWSAIKSYLNRNQDTTKDLQDPKNDLK